MSEITTFEKLGGGKSFVVVNSGDTIFDEENHNYVFLKFIPQVRALPYNCMRLHDQKMFTIKKDIKVKEVLVW
jgi:hypothetical protein